MPSSTASQLDEIGCIRLTLRRDDALTSRTDFAQQAETSATGVYERLKHLRRS